MKIAVIGLWHLGCVTAACLANAGHQVIAYDSDAANIAVLQSGQPPIFEPGLKDLVDAGIASGNLFFSSNLADIFEIDMAWITLDTPVDNNDIADVNVVIEQILRILPELRNNALVMISSQIPVGTTQQLKRKSQQLHPNKNIKFAYLPENLRLGKAIQVFTKPDRIVVGLDDLEYKDKIIALLEPFSDAFIWMSVVSAEMTKHAINAFLGLSVTFINELAALCETVGANAKEVEIGLKSEERIGPKAYLKPGGAIGGGTLMRDINYLIQLGEREGRDTFLLSSVLASNNYHKQWCCRKLQDILQDLSGKRIAILGLTYKAGTDTLRRSTAIETSTWLHYQGTHVTAYDPSIELLPEELSEFIQIKSNVEEALKEADAVVISTEWPQFKDLTPEKFIEHLKNPLVIDPSGFVAKNLGNDERIKYFSVGTPA